MYFKLHYIYLIHIKNIYLIYINHKGKYLKNRAKNLKITFDIIIYIIRIIGLNLLSYYE